MGARANVCRVDVWFEYDDVDQWVVSLVDNQDSEVECVGGYDSHSEAVESAIESAEFAGPGETPVPVVTVYENGTTEIEWTPPERSK